MQADKLKIAGALAATGAVVVRYLGETLEQPYKILYWIKKADNRITQYIQTYTRTLPDSDIAKISHRLEDFFTGGSYSVYEHIAAYTSWAVAALDDLGVRDDQMVRIIDIMTKLDAAVRDQYGDGVDSLEVGAKLADRWGDMWTS